MTCDVILLPTELKPAHLANRVAAVFDVLRATTTITAALAAGVREVRLFPTLDEARTAARSHTSPRILCGEERCVKPEGFDLGNSPGQFTPDHANHDLFLATTNGTRALLAARGAKIIVVAALVNATAVARRMIRAGLDATMLCAGTNGTVAMEDVVGAGAVVDALARLTGVTLESDAARIALSLFRSSRDRLPQVLRMTQGGKNVIEANLTPDIDFAAQLDTVSIVGIAAGSPLIVSPDAGV